MAEVLQGLRDDRETALVQAELLQFEVVAIIATALAADAAHNYRTVRQHGRTIGTTSDVLTATYCIGEQHALLHRDPAFDIFEQRLGLQVFRP